MNTEENNKNLNINEITNQNDKENMNLNNNEEIDEKEENVSHLSNNYSLQKCNSYLYESLYLNIELNVFIKKDLKYVVLNKTK